MADSTIKELDQLESAARDIRSAFYDASDSLKDFSSSLKTFANSSLKNYSKQLKEASDATPSLAKGFQDMASVFSSTTGKLGDIGKTLKDTFSSKATADFQKPLKALADQLGNLDLDLTKKQAEGFSESFERMQDLIAGGINPYSIKQIDKAADSILKFSKNSSAQKDVRKLTDEIKGLTSTAAASQPQLDGVSGKIAAVTSSAGEGSGGLGKLCKAFSGLSVAGNVVGVVGGVVEGIQMVSSAISEYYENQRKAAIEKSLEEHFGNVALSAQEVQDVVSGLADREWTVKMNAVMEAKQNISQIQQEIQNNVDNLNKMNWKVKIGVGLTEEEQESYKSSVESYVQNLQNYILENQYALELTIDAALTPGTLSYQNLSEFSSDFYGKSYDTLDLLGRELAAIVNDAFADGILSEEEIAAIQEKQAEIGKIEKEISESDFEAKLRVIQLKFEKGEISSESFGAVIQEAQQYVDEEMANIDNTEYTLLAKAAVAYAEIMGPTVKLSYSVQQVLSTVKEMQKTMSNEQIDASAHLGPNGQIVFRKYAAGGLVDEEQLAWIAEGDKPEMVIPLDPAKRSRALELYEQTGEALGLAAAEQRASILLNLGTAFSARSTMRPENTPVSVRIDYGRLAKELGRVLREEPIQCEPVVTVATGDIYLDDVIAGQWVDRKLSDITRRKERGG